MVKTASETLASTPARTLSSTLGMRRNQPKREVDLSTSETGDGDLDRDQTCLHKIKQAVHVLKNKIELLVFSCYAFKSKHIYFTTSFLLLLFIFKYLNCYFHN